MRRNIQPMNSYPISSLTHNRTINNHLRQIQSIVNAPSRSYINYSQSRNLRPPIITQPPLPQQDSDSDDDYLDDEIYDSSDSSDSSSIPEIIDTDYKKQRPASYNQIQSLVRVNLTKQMIQKLNGVQGKIQNSMNEEDVAQNDIGSCCAICLQNWKENDDAVLVPCLHRFHYECLRDWLIQKNRCPCCNSIVFE